MFNAQNSILFHLILAISAYFIPNLLLIWIVLFFVWSLSRIFNKKTSLNEFLGIIIYLSVFEIILRLTKASFPHEGIKYIEILLIVSYLINFKIVVSKLWILLALFLFISVPVMFELPISNERIRQLISANLSGPFLMLLLFSVTDKNSSMLNVNLLFRKVLLPAFTLVPLLFLLTPSIAQIDFSTNANFEASGYGPNQMASILGLICTISFYSMMTKIKVFKGRYILYVLFGLAFYRLVFTFSRGGLFTFLFLAFIIFLIDQRLNLINKFFSILISLTLGVVFYSYTNEITNNSFEERISLSRSDNLNQYSSNRVDIVNSDLKIFIDSPFLGIGPGAGYYIRKNYGLNFFVSAHTEQSRLLAEHGLVGLLILIFVTQRGISYVFNTPNNYKILTVIFVVTTFSFMLHSSTRLSTPLLLLPLSALFRNHK